MSSLSEEMGELEQSLDRLELSIALLRNHVLCAPGTEPSSDHDVMQGALFGVQWEEVPHYRRKSDQRR